MNASEIEEGDVFTNGKKEIVVRRISDGVLFGYRWDGKPAASLEYLVNPAKHFTRVENQATPTQDTNQNNQ